ncbi:hypothetical protein BV898_17585 [Hypsibius exemplaris]|uniref:Uncharacterized protein n=1 Tax=Hypsibius exemplaris TaxID=2072580 RepID=A0A9X6RMY2_HYPEX|nr:hypothetical protein BV898_17585 [Hypsibius exemplaris]
MALQPLKISNDDHADAATSENERRRAYLRRAFKIMLGLMGAFGTIRSSNSRQSKCSATFPTLRLLAVVCFFLLFLGQLTYLYLQASANLETATSLKLHFISRAQSTFNTALCLIILSRRTRKLPSVLFGIANACLWSDESQYRPLRRIVNFTVAYLGFIYGIMFPIGLIAKIVSVRGLNESLFGWSLPAEVVILSMFIIEATAISFRSIHLMTLIIMCLTLGMQFSHLTRSIKTSRQGGSIDKSAGDYGSCMGDLLYRHYRLSKLVHQFDAIFSASLFLFTASDVILLTSLMSYFISGSRLEASMGHYVTQSALDNGVFMFGAFGGVVLVLTRVMVTAYLSYEPGVLVLPPYEEYKNLRQGGSIDKSAGDYGSCMGDLLYRHYRLSKLVHQFDAIFSASLFLFTASDVILLTSLMSYFISGSRLEASMGHYVTQSALDNGVFMFGAFGGVVLVLTRVMVTAYLSYEFRMALQPLKISNDDHADAATSENERRRAYLRRAFKIMLGLMGAFGTIRSSNSRQSKCSATFPTLRLLAVVCFFLLFLGQLTYLYLQASANLETATSLKLHFISRAQSTFNTAFCLLFCRDGSQTAIGLVWHRECVFMVGRIPISSTPTDC